MCHYAEAGRAVVKAAGTATPLTLSANGTTYTDPFNTNGATPINGGDNVTVLSSRSVTFSIIFGFSPKR